MSMPLSSLTELDYKILDFVKKNWPVLRNDITGALSNYDVTPKGLSALYEYHVTKSKATQEKRAETIWRAVTLFAALLAAFGALGGWRKEIFWLLERLNLI